MNYHQLRNLLTSGKWQQADYVTTRIMLAVAGKKNQSDLTEKDIDNFPSQDICAIDQLWLKYSNGRFGFSVQKRIYQSLGGTTERNWEIWHMFGVKVGWNVGKEIWDEAWLYYDDITFNLTAPEGHLPLFLKNASGGLVLCLPGLSERFLFRVDTSKI